MTDSSAPRFSPLHDLHVAAGASFTDFGGWQMPVRYSSDLAEHHAVRTAAGLFDISHMAEIMVTGAGAAAFLDYALVGKISAVPLFGAKYSLLLAPSGGILDDLIVYQNATGEYLVVANAGNHDVVVSALVERSAGFDVTVTDITDSTVLIAVQGPEALAILSETAHLSETEMLSLGRTLAGMKYYSCMGMAFQDTSVLVARTGYTGEDGFELYVDVDDGAALWQALTAAGRSRGLTPAGLASRDTLRLEAGMPLYGHELSTEILPVQAGLGRVVALGKEGDFVGRTAVEAGPAEDARVLVGIASEGKRAGRAGYPLFSGDEEVGSITSGALSPTLGHPIAMAYVDPAVAAIGSALDIDVRGSRIPATIVSLPFYQRAR